MALTKDEFKEKLENAIDVQIAHLLQSKPANEKFLNYVDTMTISSRIDGVFLPVLGTVPAQIKAAHQLPSALLQPDRDQVSKILKDVISLIGLGGGAAMIVSAILTGMGAGAGVIATITAFFLGVSTTGPLFLAISGAVVAALSVYILTVTSSPLKATMLYQKSLKAGISSAIEGLWDETWKDEKKYGDVLSTVVTLER